MNEYKLDQILSEFPVEETADIATMVCDANHIDRGVKTYGYRNALAKLIHEEILFYTQLQSVYDKLDDELVQVKDAGAADRDPILGFDDPNAIMEHHREDVKEMQTKLLDTIIGKLNLFHLRFGCSITECLTWTSTGKYGKAQTKHAKESQASEYYAVMVSSDQCDLYQKQLQSISYKLNGIIDKLNQATKPAVKQYSMFEKQVMDRVIKAEDKVSQLQQKAMQQPIVQK